MSNIEYFKISKLFNQYDVNIPLNNKVNIFLGENGMGKTTILNCLYYVLSGKLEKLDTVVFESIEVKFLDHEPLKLENKDLLVYLEEYVFDEIRHRKARFRSIDLILSDKEKDELKLIISKGTLTSNELRNYVIRISEIFRIPLLSAQRDLERYINSLTKKEKSGDHKKVILFKNKVVELVDEEILYFPTYRRIEEDMSKLGLDIDEDDVKNRLIQFGMSDVESRIKDMLDTIRTVAITSFTQMTGVLLKQYLDGESLHNYGYTIDVDKLNISLERIGDEIEKVDKEKIKELVDNKQIYNGESEHLLNLIRNLISSYERQNMYDDKIKKFRDVCNGYLVGKKYIYNESEVSLEIHRNNYKEPINVTDLSSGEKQVISIFSKLYLEEQKPCIILFDEPELSLSIKWQEHFLPDIMKSEKCNILIAVTHSPFIFENEFDELAQDMGICIKEC